MPITWKKLTAKNAPRKPCGEKGMSVLTREYVVFFHFTRVPHRKYVGTGRRLLWDGGKNSNFRRDWIIQGYGGDITVTHFSRINKPNGKKKKV